MKSRIKKKFREILKISKKVDIQTLIDLHYDLIIHTTNEKEITNKKAPIGTLFISSSSLRCFVKHGIKDTDWTMIEKPDNDSFPYFVFE